VSDGFVYFAKADPEGPIKIGWSANPIQRIRSLNASAPSEIRLLAMFPGAKRDEWELHGELEQHRLRGEWFEDCDDVRVAMTLERYLRKFVRHEFDRQLAKRAR
jgi:Meiotically up-regulated gene 113